MSAGTMGYGPAGDVQLIDQNPWGKHMLPVPSPVIENKPKPNHPPPPPPNQPPTPPSPLQSLPQELLLKIISHLTDPTPITTTSTGCPSMRTRWALKRTCHFFHAFRELHAPADFFTRQYVDINVDRVKQERLLAAFGMDRGRGLAPCFGCRRFFGGGEMDGRGNGGGLFFEGRGLAVCLGCGGRGEGGC